MERIVTCTECPNGCSVSVELEKDKIIKVSGYLCPKGKIYAQNEIIAPRRVVTSTVKTNGEKMLPVKTEKPILKENIFKVMEIIKKITVKLPVSVGDVIYKDIDENINLIATAST